MAVLGRTRPRSAEVVLAEIEIERTGPTACNAAFGIVIFERLESCSVTGVSEANTFAGNVTLPSSVCTVPPLAASIVAVWVCNTKEDPDAVAAGVTVGRATTVFRTGSVPLCPLQAANSATPSTPPSAMRNIRTIGIPSPLPRPANATAAFSMMIPGGHRARSERIRDDRRPTSWRALNAVPCKQRRHQRPHEPRHRALDHTVDLPVL